MIEIIVKEQIVVGDLVVIPRADALEWIPAGWNYTCGYAWKIWQGTETDLPGDAIVYRSDRGFVEIDPRWTQAPG